MAEESSEMKNITTKGIPLTKCGFVLTTHVHNFIVINSSPSGQNGCHFADKILNAFHEWNVLYFDLKFT